MKIDFDINGVQEKPQLILCNPNGEKLAVMPHAMNIKITKRYNSYNELEFEIPEKFYDKGELYEVPYYDLIEPMRFIRIEEIGVFCIDSPDEEMTGTYSKKSIHANSIESLIGYTSFYKLKGTYPMWAINGTDSILKFFFNYCQDWSIGNISPSLMTTYRTFDESDREWYDFLINDVSECFDCVFDFDTLNKKVNVLSAKDAVKKSDIFASFDNVLKKSKYTICRR